MKNKIFNRLSVKKKQDLLMHVLRCRTHGLLKSTEEVVLLDIGMKRKQFRIQVFNDIRLFAKAVKSDHNLGIEVIYGEDAIKEINKENALINTGIAAIASASDNGKNVVDQLLIYIPETRRCNCECVRRKFVCDHIEHYDAINICCDLQHIRA